MNSAEDREIELDEDRGTNETDRLEKGKRERKREREIRDWIFGRRDRTNLKTRRRRGEKI